MKILTLNCGSSSIKFDVIETSLDNIKENSDHSLVKGIIEKIGLSDSIIKFELANGEKSKKIETVKDHSDALKHIVNILTSKNPKVLDSLDEISGIGHRVVHGGEEISKSVKIDDKIEKLIEECSSFAPLHNPQNLKGIQVAKEFFPDKPHVAVFDTGFHHTIEKPAYIYPLPYEFYTEDKIRRYGFHGSSHRYVSARAADLLGKDPSETKVITLHLGNGASVCAINGGKSVDTSMGFTPLEGLMMGTRCGDLDPAIILQIMTKKGLSIVDTDKLLNKQSGFLGVSGVSSDLREIEEEMSKGHERCTLSIDIFAYRLKKYIGSYLAVLNGADAIVFTGGIGEKSDIIRQAATASLEGIGISIDSQKNKDAFGIESDISSADAKIKTFVIPTDEELVIARDTIYCIEGLL